MILNKLCMLLIGLGSGVVISAGVFAFITALGIVPRLIERSKTRKYIDLYENCIIFGGIIGTFLSFWSIPIPFGKTGLIIAGLAMGMFVGSLVVALAEFINVLPIMNRRLKLTGGMAIILVTLGLGKTAGSILYWIIPGLQHVK